MNIAEHFYTSGQAASVLDVARVTVWRWVKEGKFDVQKIGKEALIPKWQVDLIKKRKEETKWLKMR